MRSSSTYPLATSFSRLGSPRHAVACALICICIAAFAVGCAAEAAPIATRLVTAFEPMSVEGTVFVEVPDPTEWRFNGEGTVQPPEGTESTFGWTAIHGVEDLEVIDGNLTGRTGELPFIAAARPDGMDDADLIHAVEVRIRVSAGENLGVTFVADEEINDEALVGQARELPPSFQTPLLAGEDFETYILTSTDATFLPSFSVGQARHIVLVPSDAEGAEFEVEYVQLITRKEELASISSGVGWHGLSEVYRETIVSRSPERVSFEVNVPADPVLDLAIGTIEDGLVTFTVSVAADGQEAELLRRTLTTANRWEPVPVDLSAFAGSTATISLSLEAGEAGVLGFWGSPVVRSNGARPSVAASDARQALTGAAAPRGVVLIIADTLRTDHLDAWGYGRETAPTLARMAANGTRFADTISQGTWTKVAMPSILTSLYPRTHGITQLPDRMPSSAVTLEEVFQEAGYATFHTSSVPFSGKLTNLHQGAEVLHEMASVADLSNSKTARTFFDRFLDWLEPHHDVPFFAMVHVFDPHSPYRPYPPYDTLFNTGEAIGEYEAKLEKAMEHIESEFMKGQGLPSAAELGEAGIDIESFVAFQHDWYDASIRAMDAEIARLLERLEMLGLAEDTLIAFIGDHGEEFQEHGRPWHGTNIYGYMINVPMLLWWPGVVPGGLVVDAMSQSIDLMPTLIDLAGIAIPDILQGQSMVPLLANPSAPESLGWERRPAFAERMRIEAEVLNGPDMDSYAIITDGWKLIHNVDNLPEGWPEYELFNHVDDPLNLNNVADANADIVQRLAAQLDDIREWTTAAKLSDEGLTEGMDAVDLERVRALGYIR